MALRRYMCQGFEPDRSRGQNQPQSRDRINRSRGLQPQLRDRINRSRGFGECRCLIMHCEQSRASAGALLRYN